MEANKLLSADVLDILFEGRNKEYGAYELRKTYNKRLGRAIAVTASVIVLLFIGGLVLGRDRSHVTYVPQVTDFVLDEAKTPDKPTPPPPPPPKVEPPKVAMRIFTPPKIVKEDVREDEKPPENDKLDDVKIGAVNQDGIKDPGITAPPVADGDRGVTGKVTKPEEDYDKTFTKVEIESSFPGGPAAWLRYLNKSMHYPDDAINNEIQGMVVVQFIVDKEGNISDVEAVSGPEQGGLREEAVRVIKKSGQWTPAIQNGNKVKSYKRQPVTFKIGE